MQHAYFSVLPIDFGQKMHKKTHALKHVPIIYRQFGNLWEKNKKILLLGAIFSSAITCRYCFALAPHPSWL